jgi:FkbM family methyltransferase
MTSQKSTWSQHGQDTVILSILRAVRGGKMRGGYFVEAGALDGLHMSNTRSLCDLPGKWRGTLIEPLPDAAAKARKNRPESTVYQLALTDGKDSGNAPFLSIPGAPALSGFSDTFTGGHNRQNGEEIFVGKRTLKEVLDLAKAPPLIDVISIDVEGAETAVLDGFDWSRKVRVWCIEHNGKKAHRAAIHESLQENGYRRVARVAADDIFIPEEDAAKVRRPYLIRVPKTGSISMAAALPDDIRKLPTMSQRKHSTTADRAVLKDLEKMGGRPFALVFGFVRNPYDRAASLYHWIRKNADTRNHLDDLCAGLVEMALQTDCSTFWSRIDIPALAARSRMFARQVDFLQGGKFEVDFIGRWERLEKDWKRLRKMCSSGTIGDLPHRNASGRTRPWQDDLNTAARVAIQTHYLADFEAYAYDF